MASPRAMIFFGAGLGLAVASCVDGSGGWGDDSQPFDGAQGSGDSSLIRRDAGLLVDPAGRYAWVQHDGSWLAVNTTSGSITSVLSLSGLSDVRVAFLSDGEAVLIANDPLGCPFQTNACTRVTHIDTVAAIAGTTRWEGSTLDFSIQSPTGRFVALSGGFATSGVYVVDGTDDLRPIEWESIAGGTGWSRCFNGTCDERLWMVGRHAIYSWRVMSGELEDEPDVAFPAQCTTTYSVETAGGSWQTAPLVAASSDGRWVAITCGRTFSLFDAATGNLSETGMNGPVTFVNDVLVGHYLDFVPGDGDGSNSQSCIQYVHPSTATEVSFVCLPTSEGVTYYVTEDGYVVASGYSSLYVVYGGDEYEPEYVELPGFSILDGKFVERLGHAEIWFVSQEDLYALSPSVPSVAGANLPFAVDDLNILPSQDQLALRSSGAVTFFSMVTGSSATIGLP